MAYTTPRTWVTGEVVTAALLNTHLRDNISYLANPPTCRAYHNTTQSIPTGSNTLFALNSERYDTDAMHDTVTNNSRLTAKTAGVFSVTGGCQWAASAVGFRSIFLIVNGATIFAHTTLASVTGAVEMAVAGQWKCAVNDYIEIWGVQTSGGGLNLSGSGDEGTWLAATWIGLG